MQSNSLWILEQVLEEAVKRFGTSFAFRRFNHSSALSALITNNLSQCYDMGNTHWHSASETAVTIPLPIVVGTKITVVGLIVTSERLVPISEQNCCIHLSGLLFIFEKELGTNRRYPHFEPLLSGATEAGCQH